MISSTPKKSGDGSVLSVTEVALVLGVHVNTVKRIPPADLPYFTVGSRRDRRYHRSTVEAYIAERTHI